MCVVVVTVLHYSLKSSENDWQNNRYFSLWSYLVKCLPIVFANLFVYLGTFMYLSQSVQLLSSVRLCTPMNCRRPGLSVHHQLPELTQTHVHWVGDAIQPSHPLSSTSLLPSIFPSIRVFSNESALQNFSFNISPTNEHPGLISFRMDWLDLLAVQGTLKSLLQHHSSKHQFFSLQLSL